MAAPLPFGLEEVLAELTSSDAVVSSQAVGAVASLAFRVELPVEFVLAVPPLLDFLRRGRSGDPVAASNAAAALAGLVLTVDGAGEAILEAGGATLLVSAAKEFNDARLDLNILELLRALASDEESAAVLADEPSGLSLGYIIDKCCDVDLDAATRESAVDAAAVFATTSSKHVRDKMIAAGMCDALLVALTLTSETDDETLVRALMGAGALMSDASCRSAAAGNGPAVLRLVQLSRHADDDVRLTARGIFSAISETNKSAVEEALRAVTRESASVQEV